MVRGIELFKDHFAEFSDRYVLIGGTAATLAMAELGEGFRATKDLDIVLCVEALDKEFAQRFWSFVRQGDYQNKQASTGKRLFYRFHSPGDTRFPEVLELFSRVPDALQVAEGSHLTPIPVGDEVSSLSAILLDDAYYALIHERKRVVDGLTIVGPDCLIPLKARAYSDLSERRSKGDQVDRRDIKKHRNDIFRLYTVLDLSAKLPLQGGVKSDLQKTFILLRGDEVDLRALGLGAVSVEEVLQELEAFYEFGA